MANKIKYMVSYEVEIYASSPSEAMISAAGHVAHVAHKMHTFPANVWDETKEFPTGTLSGAPHRSDALEGWKCLVTLNQKRDL